MSSGRSSRAAAAGVAALVLLGAAVRAAPARDAAFLEGRPIGALVVLCDDLAIRAAAEKFFSEAVGGELASERITGAIKDFYFRWPIYSVAVTAEEVGDGVALRVSVGVRPYVGQIDIRGNRQVKTSDLRSQLGFQAGDRVAPGRSEEIGRRLADYLFLRGFPAASVEADFQSEAGRSQETDVEIRITEGEPCLLSEIRLSLDRPVLSEERARRAFGVKPGQRCDAERIEKGARRLEGELRKRGHLSAAVAAPELDYGADRRRAALTVRAEPGPRIDLRFAGNTFVFERDAVLSKAIDLEGERQFTPLWVSSAAREGIEKFYRDLGYAHASVTASDETREAGTRREITFLIDRGPRVRLGKVRFAGSETFGAGRLRKEFRSTARPQTKNGYFVADELAVSVDSLLAFYQSQGFLRARVKDPEVGMDRARTRADVTYAVEEGERTILEGYRVEGNRALDTAAIEEEMGLKQGDPVDPVRLARGAEAVTDLYRGRGFKFASVEVPSLEAIPAGSFVYPVKIEEGPEVHYREIVIRGNRHTRDNVIRRELLVKAGDRYNPARLRDSRWRVLQLGFFERVSVEAANYDPVSGTEDLLVSVVERKTRILSFAPGYSTDDGLRFQSQFAYLNIAGTGRNAFLQGKISKNFLREDDIFEYRLVFTYQEPWIFGLAKGRANYLDERVEEIQFDIARRGVVLALERPYERWLRATLQWVLEYRNPFNVEPGVILSPFDEQRARFGSIGTILDLDFRDDFLNPRKGTFHRLQFDLYEQYLASQADFYRFYLKSNLFLPFYKRVRSVLSVRVGFSGTLFRTAEAGIAQIPIEKRFRLGGADSLRGFSRNCVGGLSSDVPENCSERNLEQAPGGNAVFNYMYDVLLPLFGGVDLALFTDGGNAFLNNGDFDFTDVRATAGVGLRYNTFFGPLRLDYGMKLDRRTGESFGEIHFAVGQL